MLRAQCYRRTPHDLRWYSIRTRISRRKRPRPKFPAKSEAGGCQHPGQTIRQSLAKWPGLQKPRQTALSHTTAISLDHTISAFHRHVSQACITGMYQICPGPVGLEVQWAQICPTAPMPGWTTHVNMRDVSSTTSHASILMLYASRHPTLMRQ